MPCKRVGDDDRQCERSRQVGRREEELTGGAVAGCTSPLLTGRYTLECPRLSARVAADLDGVV